MTTVLVSHETVVMQRCRCRRPDGCPESAWRGRRGHHSPEGRRSRRTFRLAAVPVGRGRAPSRHPCGAAPLRRRASPSHVSRSRDSARRSAMKRIAHATPHASAASKTHCSPPIAEAQTIQPLASINGRGSGPPWDAAAVIGDPPH